MTTPERLKRRQMIEGTVLILLAIFTVMQAVFFNVKADHSDQESRLRADEQRQCLAIKFRELSDTLKKRGALQVRESNAQRRIWAVYSHAAGLVKDDPTKPLKPADQHRLQRQLVAALLGYQEEIKAIQKSRRENPVPPYPLGTCETKKPR